MSRSKVKVTWDKNEKLLSHPRRPYAANSSRRYHCVAARGDWLRRWENQRMLSSCESNYQLCV